MEKSKVIASKKVNNIILAIILLLTLNILYKGYQLYMPDQFKGTLHHFFKETGDYFSEKLLIKAVPLLSYTYENDNKLLPESQLQDYKTSYYSTFFSNSVPLIDYIVEYESIEYQTVAELYPIITAKSKTSRNDLETLKILPEDQIDENTNAHTIEEHPSASIYTLNQLQDFNFLLSNFYCVESDTSLRVDDIQPEKFMNKSMHVDIKNEKPKVLIYHTHSQESFKDSKSAAMEDTVVGLGTELARILEDEYGINVVHNKGIYDMVDGKLNRSLAYALIEKDLKELLKKYPDIEVMIDIHRDGVNDDLHFVKDINGKQTAKIMFVNGVCRVKSEDQFVDYMYKNPYVKDNLAFSLQMQLKAAELFPGFTRKILIKPYRFNLHMCPKTLLVEVGAQTNTVQEARNAMAPLAKILYEVIK